MGDLIRFLNRDLKRLEKYKQRKTTTKNTDLSNSVMRREKLRDLRNKEAVPLCRNFLFLGIIISFLVSHAENELHKQI